MLDERKAAILRAIVEEYIATAQPVGSAHVARTTEIGVSPATVRNEMAVLEHEGYLAAPHTSAGRVPTDKGYRAFVDSLTEPGNLAPGQRQLVKDFFTQAHGELEAMLQDTSRLLSRLTDLAGVVVSPPHEVATVRAAQLVGLTGHVALLVVVLANGSVEKFTVEFPEDVGEERLGAATAHLSLHLSGRLPGDASSVPATGDATTDRAVDAALAAMHRASAVVVDGGGDEQVYVGGAAQIAASFEAVETVRAVLTTLEQQYLVVGLLRDLLERGLTVSIGSEHGLQTLHECSIVVAPYIVDGEGLGTIAVLGPTRMNYPQALAAVAVVGNRLGRRLSEG
jgi:heat-inducible transcriptional repressor